VQSEGGPGGCPMDLAGLLIDPNGHTVCCKRPLLQAAEDASPDALLPAPPPSATPVAASNRRCVCFLTFVKLPPPTPLSPSLPPPPSHPPRQSLGKRWPPAPLMLRYLHCSLHRTACSKCNSAKSDS
jgi:hypothetical protein